MISRPVKGFSQTVNFTKILLALKRPKLGIQLPNSGYHNQSCHILTVIFTLFYTNVSISTSIHGGVLDVVVGIR